MAYIALHSHSVSFPRFSLQYPAQLSLLIRSVGSLNADCTLAVSRIDYGADSPTHKPDWQSPRLSCVKCLGESSCEIPVVKKRSFLRPAFCFPYRKCFFWYFFSLLHNSTNRACVCASYFLRHVPSQHRQTHEPLGALPSGYVTIFEYLSRKPTSCAIRYTQSSPPNRLVTFQWTTHRSRSSPASSVPGPVSRQRRIDMHVSLRLDAPVPRHQGQQVWGLVGENAGEGRGKGLRANQ